VSGHFQAFFIFIFRAEMPMSVNIKGLHMDNFYLILIGEQNLCGFCFLLVEEFANYKPSSLVMQPPFSLVKQQKLAN
jgi:hypothetical protein